MRAPPPLHHPLHLSRATLCRLHQRFGTVVELYFAHGLRQSPETLKSTGFDVHQDTEEWDFIEYTVVVKLTPDEEDEPPSAMRVVGANRHFYYGPVRARARTSPLPRALEHRTRWRPGPWHPAYRPRAVPSALASDRIGAGTLDRSTHLMRCAAGRGRVRLLSEPPLPRLSGARLAFGAPEAGLLLPRLYQGRAAGQALARRRVCGRRGRGAGAPSQVGRDRAQRVHPRR